MNRLKRLWDQTKMTSRQAAEKAADSASQIKSRIDNNKDQWLEKASDYGQQAKHAATEYLRESSKKTQEQAKGLYINTVYSKGKLKDLEHRVESQGAMYRELLRNRTYADTIFVGGESLAALLLATSVSQEIEMAYAAAYPSMSKEISFLEKVRELEQERELSGFLSGVKGKLFEQKYVEYLNSGNLPDGCTAILAGNANQAGWDIQITGPNQEVLKCLQAKATDSVVYVQEALARYPSIDVVTTDEVYGHLVMSGIGENIANGGISNIELSEQIETAASAANIEFNIAPPVFTLAFIAFTSYKDESLTLYEKARSAGNRSGKTYLSYLIGGGIASVTNTWWLGVLGSVSSRYISDEGLKKIKLVESLNNAYKQNQAIINRIKGASSTT